MKWNWQSEEQPDLECGRGRQLVQLMYSMLNDSGFNSGANEQGRKKSIRKFEGDVIFCDLNMWVNLKDKDEVSSLQDQNRHWGWCVPLI